MSAATTLSAPASLAAIAQARAACKVETVCRRRFPMVQHIPGKPLPAAQARPERRRQTDLLEFVFGLEPEIVHFARKVSRTSGTCGGAPAMYWHDEALRVGFRKRPQRGGLSSLPIWKTSRYSSSVTG